MAQVEPGSLAWGARPSPVRLGKPGGRREAAGWEPGGPPSGLKGSGNVPPRPAPRPAGSQSARTA